MESQRKQLKRINKNNCLELTVSLESYILTTFEKYMREKGSCTQLVLQQLQNKLHIFVARFTVA